MNYFNNALSPEELEQPLQTMITDRVLYELYEGLPSIRQDKSFRARTTALIRKYHPEYLLPEHSGQLLDRLAIAYCEYFTE